MLHFVGRAFNEVGDSGARRHVEAKQLTFVALRKAIIQALKKNLSIRVSEQDSAALTEAIYEAEAVFDPVFQVTIGRNQSHTQNRSWFGTVEIKKFQPFPSPLPPIPMSPDPRPLVSQPGILSIPTNPSVTTPQVNLLAFVQEQGGMRSQKTFASRKMSNSPEKKWNYDVSIEQQLPWGPFVLDSDDDHRPGRFHR